MSMVNLRDLFEVIVSGHLQRHFRANLIDIGCIILIVCALIIALFGIWYDRRHNIFLNKHKL